jgi:ATP-dependent RNA helicase DDX24/MAK5
MSSKDYEHLNDLTQLSFLVVDEADRMIKQGSFPQLQQIFEVINNANPPPPDDDYDEDDDDNEEEDDDDDHTRLKGIAGVRGEAKVVMLDDSIIAAIERQRNVDGDSGGVDDNNADVMMKHGKDDPEVPMEIDDEEYERQMQQVGHDDNDDGSSDEEEIEQVVYHHRQTFVYSATLTLPPSMHHLIKKDHAAKMKMKKLKGGKNKQPTTVDGAIAEILEIAGARGKTKVVDLTNAGGSNTQKNKKSVKKSYDEQKGKSKTSSGKEGNNDGPTSSLLNRLPPGLSLGEIRCAQRHKDSHLYAYLVTTRQGSSGPCLVFCNSIAAVRRVGETLKTLGLPVKMLHAQMQQVSFSSVLSKWL